MQPSTEPGLASEDHDEEFDEQSSEVSSTGDKSGGSSNPFKQALKVFKSSKSKDSIGSQSSTFFSKGKSKLPGSVKPIRGDQMPWYTSPSPPSSAPNSATAAAAAANPFPPAAPPASGNETTASANMVGREHDEEQVTKAQEAMSDLELADQRQRASSLLSSADDEFIPGPPPAPSATSEGSQRYRELKFHQVLSNDMIEIDQLRELAWNGVVPQARPMTWQLLLGYQPVNKDRRQVTVKRKRAEYAGAVPQYFNISESERTVQEQNILRQILVDIPRTHPDIPLFHQELVQRSLERILYIWAVRHPASGYVQGINDLATPLFLVFLSLHVQGDAKSCDVAKLDSRILESVEADCYWCLTKLLDGIQDHYTFSQPGLQRMVQRLEELIQRVDAKLHEHLLNEGLQFIQFAFRWMNCLLMRELSLDCIVRLWDTYLSEPNGFENFHVYVCAAFLLTWSARLKKMAFSELLLFIQSLPTQDWGLKEVEVLLSQAFILKTLYEQSPNHLQALQ